MTPRSRAAALALPTLLLSLTLAPGARAERMGDIARGRYLVTLTGCADCHTPMKMGPRGPEPDLARGLSGHPEGLALPPAPAPQGPWSWGGAGSNTAFWGPWGISYAINLTPDPDTGLGQWSVAQFIAALRTGQHRGAGRPLAPPMPWQAYGQMNDEDLRAMFAYLQSLPPVRNAVPAYQPPPAR